MGKDTGGNRKQGRGASAPQPPAQTPAVGVAPVTKVLTPKEAGKFTREFAQQRYGTTKPRELADEWNVSLDVGSDGLVTVGALNVGNGYANDKLAAAKQSFTNYAKSNGFLAEEVGEPMFKAATASGAKNGNAKQQFRVWGP